MYLDFYGLRDSAFNVVTDPRFLYYSDSHCEAMSHVLYGVRERKGIIVVAGEAGTGKTTLIRATLGMLQRTRILTSVILNPMLGSGEDLLDAILRGFTISGYKKSSIEMIDVLERFAVQQSRHGRIPVILIDEAQALNDTVLESVRLLSNLEDQGAKLLQIVLSAQPEINEKLSEHAFRALRQRITVRCRLRALSPRETYTYIYHRIAVAGGSRQIFSADAVEALHAYSGGVPRLLNSIADNSLLAGYARGMAQIDSATVEQVAKHLELSPSINFSLEADTVHEDIVRASASWKEIAGDIRHGIVPAPLKAYVDKLRLPGAEETISTAVMHKGLGA